MVLAAVAAALGTVLVARAAAARLWLRFAAVAPIAFVALFLFASETAPLITVYRDRGLLVEVDGLGEIDDVATRIAEALSARGIHSVAHESQ